MNAMMVAMVLGVLDGTGPAQVSELMELKSETPVEVRAAWLARAEPRLRALAERMDKQSRAKPQDANEGKLILVELVDYATSVLDTDATAAQTLVGIAELDALSRASGETSFILISEAKQVLIRQRVAALLSKQPTRDDAWQLAFHVSPTESDEERLALVRLLKRCVLAMPGSRWCGARHAEWKAKYTAPRCAPGNFRKGLVWKLNGKTMPLQQGLNAKFGFKKPANVAMKLEPGLADPTLWTTHFPVREEDLVLTDGEDIIGYSDAPKADEKTFVLQTRATTVEEALTLLCAKPTRTKLPADAELPKK